MIENYCLPFGKYKGEKLQAVYEKDEQYIDWLCEHCNPGLVREVIKRFALKKNQIRGMEKKRSQDNG